MRKFLVGCLTLCLAALVAPFAFSQSNQGRITGQVTDSSGASVPGASVTIENTGKHVARTLATNEDGTYVAPNLEPGFYSVTVEAKSFKKVVRSGVQIEVGNDLTINFQLQPGTISQVVQVTTEAPLTETSNAVLNGVLSNKAINELPLQGRDFQNLLPLHPGVQREPGGGFHTLTSNGLRPDDNNFIIDGANDNDVYYGETVVNDAGISGTPASTLPLDAIQEFNTQEQPQADFGEKPGVVVNIGIKSGTDNIHGTAYYFHRNAALDARNYFNPPPQQTAALLLHQFGASLGGPIIHNKWFYFVNYEGVRDKVGNPFNVQSPVTVSLATPASPGGDPTESIVDALADTGCNQTPLPSQCSPIAMNVIKFFPNNPGFTADASDPTFINFNFNNQNRSDNLVFKSDYHFNDHHTLSGRFIYANTDQTEEDASPLRAEWLSHTSPITQVFGLDWTWTPNSRLVNTARFSYNYFYEKIAPIDSNVNPTDYGLNTGITDPRLFGFPRINPGNRIFNYLGGNSSWPLWTTPSRTQTYSDTVSYTMGKHTLRVGAKFSDGSVNYLRDNTGRGRVDFRSLDDFLLGNVRSWSLSVGDPARDISLQSWGFFAQDDFRATRRVTFNLGLRYDITTPIKDSHDRLANYVPNVGIVQVGKGISEPYQTNYNNISPRLGMAWDAFGTGKTVVRAGFGMIFVEPSIRSFMFSGGGLNMNPAGVSGVTPGNGNITTFLVSGLDTDLINWTDPSQPIFPVGDSTLSSCSLDVPCNIFGVDQKLKTPYVLNWNINVQQQLTPSMALQVAYVANHGVKLYSTTDPNQPDPAISGPCIDDPNNDFEACEQSARPLVTSCPVAEGGLGLGGSCLPYIGFLNYLSNKSTSTYNSLQVTLTKRYSHGLYLLAGYTYGHGIDTAGNTSNLGFVPQNSLDYAAEKGSSDFDIRHRFTLSATYELPSKKSWAQMLEGWQVTSLATVETGPPVLLYDDSDDLTGTGEGFNNAGNDRWNIIGDPSNLKWSHSDPLPSFDASDPICTSAANTQALLDALDYVGYCYAQNGTVLYPNAFYTFGNMGRNIFRGPGFVNWDASIGKTWAIKERMKLQFRAEFFNLLNHPNFSSSSISGELGDNSSVGQSTTTPDIEASNPVIGSGGSRHIQLGLKLVW